MAGWFGHKQPEVWTQATGSLVTNDRKFGHKRPEVWSQTTGSLVTSNTELSTICRSLTPAFRLGCRHTPIRALALTARNMAFFTSRSYTLERKDVYKHVGVAL